MKSADVLAIFLSLFWIVACESVNPIEELNPQTIEFIVKSFEADGEGDYNTKTNIGEGNSFVWSAHDTVGIYPDKGSQVFFAMTSGAGASSAEFDGGGWDFKPSAQYWSYSPFIGDIYLNAKKIHVSYLGQQQHHNNNTDGIGPFDYMYTPATSAKDGKLHFTFSHLNCILKAKMLLPAGQYTKLVLSLEDQLFVEEGEFNLIADTPSIIGKKYTNKLQLDLDITLSEETTLIAYILSAPIDMSGKVLTAKIYNSIGKETEFYYEPSKPYIAGRIYSMSMISTNPNNVIHYTSSNNQIITPLSTAFDSEIISNEYKNGLGTITFASSSIHNIGNSAFKGCNNLTSITIPESITNIESSAFEGCDRLESFYSTNSSSDNRCIVINDELVAFAPGGLTSYIIPNGIKGIGAGVFKGCTNLLEITIPEGVTRIGDEAFMGCSNLNRLVFERSAYPAPGESMFNNTANCPIFVPAGSVKTYQNAKIWSAYADRIVCQIAVPEAIDVGLSVKWASFNLGASKPEERGYYYSWGEITEKSSYSWQYYRYCKGSESTLTKYTDTASALSDSDDAAKVLLGGKWRMPTWSEYYSLIGKLDWRWENNYNSTNINGIVGYIKYSSGETIDYLFFPASGWKESSLKDSNTVGSYWIANRKDYNGTYFYDITTSYPERALAFLFQESNVKSDFTLQRAGLYLLKYKDRAYGYNIRPVWDPNL